jgi:hypothetical protein
MAIFSVSYDLRSPGRNYNELYAVLSGSGIRALESLWFVESNMSPAEVRDILRERLDANDGLFVSTIESGPTWAAAYLLPEALQWLEARRP